MAFGYSYTQHKLDIQNPQPDPDADAVRCRQRLGPRCLGPNTQKWRKSHKWILSANAANGLATVSISISATLAI